MLIIATADWHLRSTTPVNRIDDIPKAVYNKVEFIVDLSIEHNAPILVAGDIFDTAFCPYHLPNSYIYLLKSTMSIIAVPGQHDLRYHNLKTINNTPFNTLVKSGVIQQASRLPYNFDESSEISELIDISDIYGAGWQQKIPKVENEKATNILLTHQMVIGKKPLWAGQTDYTKGSALLKKGFNIVISGDNHNTFTVKNKDGGLLINPGSLLRSKSDQLNHKPSVFIVDTVTKEYERIYIPIKESKLVFDLKNIKKRQESKTQEKFKELVDSIKFKKKKKPDFIKTLNKIMKEIDIPNETRSIIEEVVDKCHSTKIS